VQPQDTEFMRELMTIFSSEADERLAAIDQRLLDLERTSAAGSRSELLQDILRELHTLKGSAGAVNMPEVSRLAHGLEGILGGVAPDEDVEPRVYEAAYRGLDAMRTLIGDFAGGRAPSVDVDGLLEGLLADAPPPAPVVGEPAPPRDEAPGASEAGAEPPPTAVEPAAPQAPRPAPGPQADGTVRLATNKLDSLMARVGELVVTRIGAEQRTRQMREVSARIGDWEREWRRVRPRYLEIATALGGGDPVDPSTLVAKLRELLPVLEQSDGRLSELTEQTAGLREGIEGDERRLGQVTSDLEDEVRRTRMLPVSTVFDPLHRIVRDLSRDLGKEVALTAQGGGTEVDRSVLEQIRGPITHLIRNAVDHGLEPPDVRERCGKAREGSIRLAAVERAGTLVVSLSDDGAGIDVGRVRATAIERGIGSANAIRALGDREALRLVFRPGLSTSGAVTDISGRGVGLDVVRDAVERLHGAVDVSSEPGVGTTFTLSLPLSVATTQCLLVGVGERRFALPISAVARIVPVGRDEIRRAQGREMLSLQDGPIVLARLEDVLQLPGRERSDDGARRPAVIVGADERRFALLIDELQGTQDVVVKPLPPPFLRVRHTAGATVLGSGEIVVILNASDLIRTAVSAAVHTAVRHDGGVTRHEAAQGRSAERTVLVVDDSIVTRMLEKSILEAAGYTVRVAADGVEAWRSIEAQPVDLIVSDVNMPEMDGLALTARVRGHSALKATPIVLVTSLDAPEDHARAVEVGADAYIVKSSFSQEGLLETVGRLI
jgi:two-component system chemotaxis sensor kinase CheA